MRNLIITILAINIASFTSCSSSSSVPAPFCDTSCVRDSMKFTGDHKLKPYVYISPRDCMADSIAWSYSGMGINRKTGLTYLLNTTVRLNKEYVRVAFKDTGYAWVMFNDCETGRGYQLKLPFNERDDIGRKSSGVNNLDPKFKVDNSLVAYTDRGNIFVEDIATGKKAMMTFGKALDIDYDTFHETLDTVNITPTRIWVRVKVDGEWQELQKKIVLE